ncbi:putative amidoligase enzyme-domain-containing protein [Chaetomium fimeti]|uniref:Amidoligase enzyme-domain-containing protein n=1 Tax=Chaetomium fimeti TaxID=1854472 RepID=A0AAE0HQV1_9PEZI|nr:putative amidoligase enzyme-domain-containing protein [Chaetomium fimeti]
MASSSRTKTAPPAPKPLFGVEIEIYVKIKSSLADRIRERRYRDRATIQKYWLDWEFDLENGQGNLERKAKQRECVGQAIREIIDITLGDNHGWTCESDASLKEWALTAPPNPRKWWGIEIISPPMSVTKHWQEEIELIFSAVGKHFDFWTNECCACHVHVSPGPTKRTKYTTAQLVKMAKGAYFWEDAFYDLLPPERRNNRLGTVELRRQAGVASAMTAIHRILFALTLHISAFRYDFDGVRTRKTRPDSAELIRELAGCIKKLPSDTCHGSRFVGFLNWCQESYANNCCFTEEQINARERALRNGTTPPNQRSSRAPAASSSTTASRPSTPAATTTLPSRPAPRRADPPRSGSRTRLPSQQIPGSSAPTAHLVSSSGGTTRYEVREPPYREPPYGGSAQYGGTPQYGTPQYGTPQYGGSGYGTPGYGSSGYGAPGYGGRY